MKSPRSSHSFEEEARTFANSGSSGVEINQHGPLNDNAAPRRSSEGAQPRIPSPLYGRLIYTLMWINVTEGSLFRLCRMWGGHLPVAPDSCVHRLVFNAGRLLSTLRLLAQVSFHRRSASEA